MKAYANKIVPLLVLIALGGCATVPTGPSVMVLPTQGKPFEQFQAEDARCRAWAADRIGASPQEVANQSAINSAAVGTVIGAGVGAVLGAAAGDPGAGAAIGAGSGLFMGSAAGADASQAYAYDAQHRYDNAYVQCMYSYGNQVPTVRRARRVRAAYPPPPPPGYYYEERY